MPYLPGSFFVVDVKGPGGWWIGVAQALSGNASRYKHAGLILDADGTILEAEPQGARLANISEYAGDGLLISDPIASYVASMGPPCPTDCAACERTADSIRQAVVAEGRKLVGTRYSWCDYAAIGLLRLHLPSSALRRYVAASGHAQCAQLVDLCFMRAGVHIFSDGRAPGEVTPADLAACAEDQAAKT